jgi:ribosome-associated protein
MEDRPHNAIELGGGVWCRVGDLAWSFARSGGPGGQNVNKVSTKAELRVAMSCLNDFTAEHAQRLKTAAGRFVTQEDEIVVVCDETRSQLDNRERCIEKLKSLIEAATTRPKARRKTKPTRGSKERRLKEKKQAGERKNRRSWKPEE